MGLALVREVLDELEERRLRPVDVVEDEDERLLAGERLAELPEKQAISGAGGEVSSSSAVSTASPSAPPARRAPPGGAST